MDGLGGRLRAREQENNYILNLEETKENKNVNLGGGGQEGGYL